MNWPFWLDVLSRSAAILIAGELLRRLSRAESAAFRHKLMLWVLLLLGAMPILTVILPEIRIPLATPAPAHGAQVTVQELSRKRGPVGAVRYANWALLIWAAGVLLSATPLLIGSVSAWRIGRRASPFRSGGLPFPSTEILASDEISLPLTSGIWRPRILLPGAAEHWSASRLQAVLLHEMAHVRRRDVAAQVAAHLVAALWWFQPLVWFLRGRLREESELACDAEALKTGFRPSEYATELLAVAKAVRPDWGLSSCSISMARGANLEQRVRAILNPASIPFSRKKFAGVSATLAAIALGASALSLGPDQSFSEQGGSIMKRTLVAGLLTSAGLSAAFVGGSIHDPSGAALGGASVSIFNPDTGAKQETTSDASGKFSLSGAGAGQYILRIEKAGFVPLFREFDLKAESSMQRQYTLTSEGAPQATDQGTASTDGSSGPVHVRGEVAQNNLIKKVQPVYPVAAKADHVQGTVEIEATMSKDGVPMELRVVSSPSAELSESSLEAVRQWRYRPTLLNGAPVGIVTTIIVNYTLAF